MITAYPKIFQLGTVYIRDIFDGPVEVTEKVDGSQFAFGRVKGQVYYRSKGALIFPESCPKLFKQSVDYIASIQDRLPDNVVFYGEILNKPKHHAIKYDRVPKNNIALFGVQNIITKTFLNIDEYGFFLDIDCVPVLKSGSVHNMGTLSSLLETESFLGGSKIEGIVVKNYNKPFLFGGRPIPVMAGKLVREEFKELNKSNWNTEKNKFQVFLDSLKTEARWNKAIQHLNETGDLAWEPKDIGKLIREINTDLETEEIDEIKGFLWKHFKGDILRSATKGFPEWWKMKLASRSFNNE